MVTDYFKEKFNFRRPTIEEESGDWWKYSTGNHEEYAEARATRTRFVRITSSLLCHREKEWPSNQCPRGIDFDRTAVDALT